MTPGTRLLTFLALCTLALEAHSADSRTGNRLTYLDESDPFYVQRDFPKLTTPQWIGESGVEAVVILAIDDMREPQRYETVLRPILERLKKIDGRAPVSIMCNTIDPVHPQLQAWLKEGLSLEVHTLVHPCPLLARSNFPAAAETYHGSVGLMNRVLGNRPIAFRMPCCDSMNSPSPRFYAEIFNRTNAAGQFLTIDSSVMNILTPKDRSLPRELVVDPDGRERFRKYLPVQTNAVTRVSMGSFVTTIEDYPYPYVIGKICWEFPAMVPSDWEAQNVHGVNNPATVADWEAALDATVIKQGAFTFIFHPHGWIKPEQMVEFIDYAVQKYGKKVKFLNFREAQERLDKNLLAGVPLRAADGHDNGVRLFDANNDGFLDVTIGNSQVRKTRTWDPNARAWSETSFPTDLAGVQFGILREDGRPLALKVGPASHLPSEPTERSSYFSAWQFDGQKWIEDRSLINGLELNGPPLVTVAEGRDTGVRFRDMDNDGRCELIVANETQQTLFSWNETQRTWKRLPNAWPQGVAIANGLGEDNGVRFTDINEDGFDDLIVSNERGYALWLYIATPRANLGWERGWTFKLREGQRGEPNEIPLIVRSGASRNNGAWFHSRYLWVQNEDVAHLPDKVDRRSFTELLTGGESPPKSPTEALAAFKVRPGFRIELAANEPLVVDPVAFDWGADGKFWVVEMHDYPSGIDNKGKPGGRVIFLEDTDDDGKYDKRTVFLDGLKFPNGIMPWRNGVLISTAPEIIFAEDTDGDGKADVRKVILTGFGEGNQQHRVNGFEYGLDNWVYAANGDSGGSIRSLATGKTADIRGHDIRFRPDTGEFETVAGQTQFGRHRDDWGNWFGNNNPTWLWHYYLPEHYLTRNPNLAVRGTRRILSNYPQANRIYTVGRLQQRYNWPDAIRQTTSANSATPYRDEVFGPDFATSVFVSEPANNVVHHEVLEPDGVSFTSHRARDEQDSEFLASADNWFRPTMLKTGPDGALYVADMYRLVIEHPEYFPEELKKRPDLRAGDDKGRIYRVYPEGATLRKIPRLDQFDNARLAAALGGANGWERDTAQRLLVHRQAKEAKRELLAMAATHPKAKTRIQSLATLDGLRLLDAGVLSDRLGDAAPTVREFAVQLSEPYLKLTAADGELRRLQEQFVARVEDQSVRVCYQLAFSLGEWRDARAGRALAQLALKDWDNAEMRTAILSSAVPHIDQLVGTTFGDREATSPPANLVEQLTSLATALNDESAISRGLAQITKRAGNAYAEWQFAGAVGFLDGLDRRGISLREFAARASANLKSTLDQLDPLLARARAMVNPDAAIRNPQSQMLLAIRLLGRGTPNQDADLNQLAALLNAQVPTTIQQAALNGLKQTKGAKIGETLVSGWRGYGPNTRQEVMNLLFGRTEWIQELLAAIEAGKISTGELGLPQQQKLLFHSQPAIRARAAKLFSAMNADRQEILKQYDVVKTLTGNASKGAALFRQHCASCHKFKDEGNNVGPDLGSVADKSVSALLVAILNPNQAVDAAYVNYFLETRNGRELSGIIAAETPNSVTIRATGGIEEIVLRSDLKELRSSGLSLMPEGFETALKPQDMADLIAHVLAR